MAKREKTSLTISKRKRRAFLKVFARTGQVSLAYEAAGYKDGTYLRRLYHADKAFAKEWDEAAANAGDMLESEAWRRAHDGVMDDVYYKGEIVGHRVNYSDNLLVFLLRGNKPKKYRESVSIDGEIRHRVGVALLPMTAPVVEDWERAVAAVHADQKKHALTLDSTAEVVHTGPITDKAVEVRRS